MTCLCFLCTTGFYNFLCILFTHYFLFRSLTCNCFPSTKSSFRFLIDFLFSLFLNIFLTFFSFPSHLHFSFQLYCSFTLTESLRTKKIVFHLLSICHSFFFWKLIWNVFVIGPLFGQLFRIKPLPVLVSIIHSVFIWCDVWHYVLYIHIFYICIYIMIKKRIAVRVVYL